MPLLRNRRLVEQDSWQFLHVDAETGQLPQEPWSEAAVLPAAHLADLTEDKVKASKQLGAWLTTEEDHELLLPWLDQLQLIAIEFPVFRDGRGFSQARLLRRAGFKGELRAIGDVARDRLAYLERCGFDAFDIAEERFNSDDLQAFSEISVSYQVETFEDAETAPA
ncbi:Uncharacterized conserved protein, DUF934 family [Marinospirillum celere]|uniref:Uncharacterized conserved protein, DUF934 family n=1 Tax=Marinospirillum celere TaxID=1122252 RepID=A0A1I1G3V0_9GAMM|nr:DUF934 domain-containing protein [Marinospirillum celere]SFC06529.1 Uncharacterized conserved protein, DUF934 family [Marinospirillum celere]